MQFCQVAILQLIICNYIYLKIIYHIKYLKTNQYFISNKIDIKNKVLILF